MATAERLVGLLTSPEPWRFLRNHKDWDGPDDYYCCPGTVMHQCGCGGLTVREWCEQQRKGLPAIEWIRIESRNVTSWSV